MKWQTFEKMEAWRHWMSRKRLHLVIIGILVIDILLLIALFEPIRWFRQRLEGDIQVWQSNHQQLQMATRSWEEALERLRNALSDRQRLMNEQFLPESEGYPIIRSFLENAAQRSGVQKETITYQNKALQTLDLVELKISIPVRGTYAQIRQFLQEIERSKHFLIIESVTWRATPRSNLIDVDITLRTYFIPSDEGALSS